MRLNLYRTAELPDTKVWWTDDDGLLINFVSGHTFTVKLGNIGASSPLVTKTTGITGAVGSGTGVSASDAPNVTITWAAGELAAVPAGVYTLQLTATSAGGDRVMQIPAQIVETI